MAGIPVPPRSVTDATRFTQTTPHATRSADVAGSSTARSPGGSARPTSSRFQAPEGTSGAGGSGGQPPRGPAPPTGETPAQRVARLRAAHQAAKNAQVSGLDRLVDAARRTFDSVHRVTIVGLIGFSAVAAVLTAYTTVDMLRFNRKRKAEFLAAQRQMEDDSLAAARLAYMQGKATAEQAALVEAASDEEERRAGGFFGQAATTTGGVGLGGLLGAPQPVRTEADKKSWLASTLSREEEGEKVGSSQRRLGYESLSEEDDGQGVRESDVVRAVEDRQSYLAAKAQAAALERERALQRQDTTTSASTKSWWKFW